MPELIKIVIELGIIGGIVTGVLAVLFGMGSIMNWLDVNFGFHSGIGNTLITAGWVIVAIVVIILIVIVARLLKII